MKVKSVADMQQDRATTTAQVLSKLLNPVYVELSSDQVILRETEKKCVLHMPAWAVAVLSFNKKC
ncbi:hypothetical protein [Paenibacillus qinlingensis]|uniref:hypothetical protein n=1 Tax=Paenibacillus qinlingensis TaxID=1837343 RepID=UPI001567BC78